MYYIRPTQVRFFDCGIRHAPNWYGGIAIADQIICGCCGNICSINALIEAAKPFNIEPTVKTLNSWEDISKVIVEADKDHQEIKILVDKI